ncbi:MAG: hypothetical protein ACTSQY_10865, partial [Candidatus Odinarchaeia archaeon]
MITKKQRDILDKMIPGKKYGRDEAIQTFGCQFSDLTGLYKAGYIDIPEYHLRGRNWHFIKIDENYRSPSIYPRTHHLKGENLMLPKMLMEEICEQGINLVKEALDALEEICEQGINSVKEALDALDDFAFKEARSTQIHDEDNEKWEQLSDGIADVLNKVK